MMVLYLIDNFLNLSIHFFLAEYIPVSSCYQLSCALGVFDFQFNAHGFESNQPFTFAGQIRSP